MKSNTFFVKSDRNKRLRKPLLLEFTITETKKSIITTLSVDAILDKISDFGITSLAIEEKAFLVSESKKIIIS